MNSSQATTWLTDARFEPYLEETNGDHEDAVALYVWNARVSAACFETLHHTEVLLRNAIDAQFAPVIAAAAPAETWLEDHKILNAHARNRVGETIARIRKDGKTPTRGRVVAGLSFGFWRALFDRKYEQLWVTHLYRAFPSGTGSRHQVAALTSRLVPFRNRVAHHETIIRRPITTHYEDMLELAGLIDTDARTWIESVTRVPEILDSVHRLLGDELVLKALVPIAQLRSGRFVLRCSAPRLVIWLSVLFPSPGGVGAGWPLLPGVSCSRPARAGASPAAPVPRG